MCVMPVRTLQQLIEKLLIIARMNQNDDSAKSHMKKEIVEFSNNIQNSTWTRRYYGKDYYEQEHSHDWH